MAQRNRQNRLRNFVFTLNNWTQEEWDYLTTSFAPTVKWLVIGKEIGENGTPHLQGACVIGKQIAFSTLKTLPGFCRAHMEPMFGKPIDSLNYCTKQDKEAFVHGDLPSPGKRNDILNIAQRIQNGESLASLASTEDGAAAIIKYSKGINHLRSITRKYRQHPPKVFWIYGPTGTGKTRAAFEAGVSLFSSPEDVWISSGGLRWFDGYDGQPVAIFDDFRAKHVSSFAFLLRILDRYPVDVEIKGGFVKWTPNIIFITCPSEPDECFQKRREHIPEDVNQLCRRITKVYHFRTLQSSESRAFFINQIRDLSKENEENENEIEG